MRISGQRARLSASIAAGPLLCCTSVTGRNLGAKKKPGGGRLIVSILDSQSSVGSAGKVGRCGCVFSHCLFCRSRMTPLRPDLSALAVRHLVCQSSPLSTAFASRIQDTGRLGGSFIFLLLGKLAALVFWAFVGRDVPIFAPIFGITGKICRQCKHISRVFVILLIGVPTAPLILDLSYHRHQRSSDLLDFRISVSRVSCHLSVCHRSEIRNWCQASSHRLKISAQFGSEASIVKVPAETVPSPVEEVPCAGAPLPPCPAFIVPSLNCCGTCRLSRALRY